MSNTWTIPLTEATARLEIFYKENESEGLHREYLVRGITKSSSTVVITVVSETNIKAYEKKLSPFSKSLFSVCKKRNSYETLHYKLEKPQVINLPLDIGSRPVEVHVIPAARPAMEKKKKENIFAVPANSKKPTTSTATEDKKKIAADTKLTPQEKTPQKTSKSPEKGKSSAVKTSAEKKQKHSPKIQMGKGSIASFFGQKSTEKKTEPIQKESPKATATEEDAMDVDDEPAIATNKKRETTKAEPEPTTKAASKKTSGNKKDDETSRKRNLSSDHGSTSEGSKKKSPEEPSSKKAKKEVKTKKADKRSRIMTICDSDSSGDEAAAVAKRQEESEEEEDVKPRKVEPEEKKKTSPDENRNPDNNNKRRKAMRKVTKSYQDEDGFISKLSVNIQSQ